MSKREMPPTLNDGKNNYKLVRPAKQYEDGREDIALYDRDPSDPKNLFSPDLSFVMGKTAVPIMIPFPR